MLVGHRWGKAGVGRDFFRVFFGGKQIPTLTKGVKALVDMPIHLGLEEDAPTAVAKLNGLIDRPFADGTICKIPIVGCRAVAARSLGTEANGEISSGGAFGIPQPIRSSNA